MQPTWSKKHNHFHADILKVINFQTSKLIWEIQHFLNPFLDPEFPGRLGCQDPIIRDSNETRWVDWSIAAWEDQELTPSVD